MADGGEILYGWVLCEVAKVPGEDDAPETFTLVVLGFTMDEADFTQASYHWPICAIQDAAVILAVANGTVIGWSDDSSLVGEIVQNKIADGAAFTIIGLAESPGEVTECFEHYVRTDESQQAREAQ